MLAIRVTGLITLLVRFGFATKQPLHHNPYQAPFIYDLLEQQANDRPVPQPAPAPPPRVSESTIRPVECAIRESQGKQCDLNVGPDKCNSQNWTVALSFTSLNSEIRGTFLDFPDEPIDSEQNPMRKIAQAEIAYRIPPSSNAGGIAVAVVKVTASCCVRRLTVVGYTPGGSADHCSLNLCKHNVGQCNNGGLCTAIPGVCACDSHWTGASCEISKEPPVSNSLAFRQLQQQHQLQQYPNTLSQEFTPEHFMQQELMMQRERQLSQRWCPDKFLCCDHGLAYYDPESLMMCCNNRAVAISNFTKACPEIAQEFVEKAAKANEQQSLPPAPSVYDTMKAAGPANGAWVQPGVLFLKDSTTSVPSVLQKLTVALKNNNGEPTEISNSDLALLATDEDGMMEVICNGITHWVTRNNRARYGCCGGKIYDIVWDHCSSTLSGLTVFRKKSPEVGQNVGNRYVVDSAATLAPPPTPMGTLLRNENEAPSRLWLNVNVSKKQQINNGNNFARRRNSRLASGPKMQRRRRLINRNL